MGDIDKETAEKVMGWKVDDLGTFDKNGVWENIDDWLPSTNIEHAMEVEAEMFKRGFVIMIDHEIGGQFEVSFFAGDCSKPDAVADILPEAICKAALKAINQ